MNSLHDININDTTITNETDKLPISKTTMFSDNIKKNNKLKHKNLQIVKTNKIYNSPTIITTVDNKPILNSDNLSNVPHYNPQRHMLHHQILGNIKTKKVYTSATMIPPPQISLVDAQSSIDNTCASNTNTTYNTTAQQINNITSENLFQNKDP